MTRQRHLILEQASKWFMRLKDAAPDHVDRSKFEAWLMESEAHRQAYQSIAETWGDFDSSAQISHISQAMSMRKLDEDIRKRQKSTTYAKLGAIAIIGLSSLFGFQQWQEWHAKPLETIAQTSAPGHMVSRYLSDGTKLTLDAHSDTKVLYYRDKRYVQLLHGQAVFEVVKDADRPFIVESNHSRVTVKGTRFVVNMINHKTVVAVDHGKVLVETLQAGQTNSVLLTDGQVAEVKAQASPVKVQKPAKDYFAFLQGKLIFDGAPLNEVTETLSRYREPPLVNHSHANAEISAVVDVKTLNKFIKTLPAVAPVKLQESDTETTVLDR
jgi:transmembrane sensor